MSKKNPEYDFKWCPGCGDFGVRRSVEFALKEWSATKSVPIENTVVVAGILRAQGVNAEAITQYTGLPFRVRDLVERINKVMKNRPSRSKEMVRA